MKHWRDKYRKCPIKSGGNLYSIPTQDLHHNCKQYSKTNQITMGWFIGGVV